MRGGGGGGGSTEGILIGFLMAQAASGGGYNSRDRVNKGRTQLLSNSARAVDEAGSPKNSTSEEGPSIEPCYPWLHPNYECPQDKPAAEKEEKSTSDVLKEDPNAVEKSSKDE